MNFWTWVDRNGFGIGFVILALSLFTLIGGLTLAGKIGGGPTLCTVPCDEVRSK